MPTIAEVRQKYPQYNDLSDQQLGDALHQKFYSDMPREQFDAKIGLTQQQTQQTPPQEGVLAHAFHRLTGTGGQERYQLWPERAIRGSLEAGAEMTEKAVTGQYGPTGQAVTQEDPGKILSAASLGVTGAPGAIGAVRSGAAAAERSAAVKAATPTKAAVKDSAKAGYDQLQQSGLQFSDPAMLTLGEGTRAELEANLQSEIAAPTAYAAVKQLEKSGGNLAKIVNTYSKLGEVKPSAGQDYNAAQTVRKAINDFFENVNPETDVVSGDPGAAKAFWDHARASWRSYAQMDQVETLLAAGERRAATTGTGANTQNVLRQEIRKVLDSDARSRGYSKDAKQAMEDIVMGNWLTNSARYVGKFAPSGPVTAAHTITAGLTGLLTGGVGTGAELAALVAIPTTVAKYLGVYLTKKQIADLERVIAQESPIGRSAVKAAREAAPSQDVDALAAGTPALAPGAASTAADALRRPTAPRLDL